MKTHQHPKNQTIQRKIQMIKIPKSLSLNQNNLQTMIFYIFIQVQLTPLK